jgi:hypothetical protein
MLNSFLSIWSDKFEFYKKIVMLKLIQQFFGKFFMIVLMTTMVYSCNIDNSIVGAEPEAQEFIDVTIDAELTVSDENPGGPSGAEGSNKLIDNDANTKFLVGYNSDFWAQQEFSEPQTINTYSITSGNDAPDRDPVDWTLLGSNDGSNWEEIDTVTGGTFESRNFTKLYELDSEVTYSYFRWTVSSNAGSGAIQVSEWRILDNESS